MSDIMSMNVLWICADQQRYDTLGCYGNKFVKTPNLDRLAGMGARFERAYTQSPVCAPSRASFLTGRYPRTCGVRQNGQDISGSETLVTKLFADAGYMCGLAGKLHLSACGRNACKIIEPRIDDGYHYFKWSHHPAGINKNNNWPMNDYTMWLSSKGAKFETLNRDDCKYVQVGMDENLHQSKWCVDMALECIQSAKNYDLPWFFSMNLFDPHHPFDPPAEYLERYLDMLDDIPLPNYTEGELDSKPVFQKKDQGGAYDTPGNYPYPSMSQKDHRMLRAAYWAMIDLLDVQMGRLFDYLESTGQFENTLIIFTSDHGESLGDHGMYLKGPYFYDCNVRVPLIISCPSLIKPGMVSPALVELVDLAPTLCEAAGITADTGMQGRSLWPMLTGNAPADSHRGSVYCEYYNANINHRDPLAFTTMVRDDRYKLVRVHDRDKHDRDKKDKKDKKQSAVCELYDLESDPSETFNQADNPEYAAVKMRMLELMCDRMAETCDPLPFRKSFW